MANVIRQEFAFGGLFTSLAESKIPIDRAWSMSNCLVEFGIIQARPGYALFGARSSADPLDVGWGLGYGRYSGDESQTIRRTSGTISGGTWTITWNGQTTTAIQWDATAEDIQSAMEDLSNLLVGDIVVEGNGWTQDDRFRFTFKGQYANTNVVQLTVTTTLLTGTGTIVVTPETEIQGGLAEEYVAVVQHAGSPTANLYTVDPSTGTYTSVLSGLHSSDWHFIQYGNKIYGVNAHQGIISKLIGSTAGLSSSRPTAPAFAPDATTNTGARAVSTSGMSAGGYVGWGTDPIPSITGGGAVVLALDGNISAGTTLTVDLQWSSNQDFSLDDLNAILITASKPINLDGTQHLNTTVKYLDASANIIEPGEYGSAIYSGSGLGRYIHWQGEERSQRKVTRKVRVSFRVDVSLADGVDTISVQLIRGRQWQNDSNPLDVDNAPTQATIDYAVSYRDLAGGLESDLSPVKTQALLPPTSPKWGANVTLEGDVSAQLTNTDLLYFYRREKATGTMRRLPNIDGTFGVLNTGTPQLTDTYLESELAGFPEFGVGESGLGPEQLAGPAVAICTWKQCLTIAGKKQAYTSWIGQPNTFAPSPDEAGAVAADDIDPDRGRTDYVSDNRAEDVFGLAGQDSLFAATSLSAYAMVGDTPAESAVFKRLPGSRGAVGVRATCPLGGGFEVVSQDGIWYYSVSRSFTGDDNGAMLQREETAEIRQTVEAFAFSSSTVIIEHNDELWMWDGTEYLLQTRSRKWTAGVFADSVKAAISNRIRGLKFLDSKGRMMSVGSQYTTDNGVAITWHYETGWLESTRAHIKGVRMFGSGTPVLKTYVNDGAKTVTSPVINTKASGKVAMDNFSVSPGWRYKLRVEGANANDTLESLVILVEKAPEGAST